MGTATPSTANANAALTTWTASAAWVQLHTGAPGASGTANVSSVTTRMAVTWNAPVSGTITAGNSPQWTGWAGADGEAVTWLSFWSQASGGTFEFSMPLDPPASGASAGAVMHNQNTLTLSSLQVTVPAAA